jgi:hypothetical protein
MEQNNFATWQVPRRKTSVPNSAEKSTETCTTTLKTKAIARKQ